jgi:hypothetical protein
MQNHSFEKNPFKVCIFHCFHCFVVKNKHLRIIFWFYIERSIFSFQMFDKTNLQKFNLQTTGGPRYIQEIVTKKLSSHIMNLHLKIPRIPVN